MEPALPAPRPPTSRPDEERELLRRLRAADEGAFAELVELYGGRMRATALRLLRNEEDADDVLQEAFVSAFKAIQRFDGRSQLSTWLHRIVVNAALMRLRTRQRRPEIDEEALEDLLPRFSRPGAFAELQVAWDELPLDEAERADLCAFVRRSIERLPDKFRIALLLRDIEGLSNDRVAAHLGVSLNAAKIRVHRARQALRTLLHPRLAHPPE